MTSDTIKKIAKNIKDDKYFFAAYLNMARHNIYLNIVDIALRIGINPPENDDQIFGNGVFSKLTDATKPDVKLKIQGLLRNRFPFLESLMVVHLFHTKKIKKANVANADFQDYYTLFQSIFNEVNQSRNNFTHEYKTAKVFDSKLLSGLKAVFDASVYKTKDQFGFSTADTQHLIRKGKGGKEPSFFNYAFEKEGNITEKGMAFFICLFLEKKYAYLFLKQLYGFKDGKDNKARATLEAYCAYSIKLPKMKIESESQDTLLYMDMLNELKRCPTELYEHLHPQQQARFKVKSEESDNQNSDIAPEITLKRNNNRFPYFFLRYWDEMKSFDRLRFCVDLGNYHFDVYDKEIAGEMRTRRLTKKLLSFGRFQDFSLAKLKENYGDLVKPSSEIEEDNKEKYIVETFPHYHLDNSNVAIKIIDSNKSEDIYPSLEKANAKGMPYSSMPDVWLSQYELLPLAFYGFLNRKNNNGIDVSFDAQTIIIRHTDRIRAFFKDLKEEKQLPLGNKDTLDAWLQAHYKGLRFHHIPSEVQRIMLQKRSANYEDLAEKKIVSMIAETSKRLEQLKRDLNKEERKNKIGRSEYREVKAGVLADFIAEDLMRFQATVGDNKGKATGLTYQVLQATIAFYGGTKKELKTILKDCNLIDAPNEHPFLKNLDYENYNGIIDFYSAYLKARITYLEKCKTSKQYDLYFWLHLNKAKRRKEDSFLKELAENYLAMPIYFPRGLFTEAIKDFLINNSSSAALKSVLQQSERTNVVFMLQKYFELELGDASQDFYNEKRSYEIFDKFNDGRRKGDRTPLKSVYFTAQAFDEQLYNIKKWIAKDKQDRIYQAKSKEEKEHIQNNLTGKEKALVNFEKNEKQLRHEKAQDMVLFLLVKDLMLKTSDKALWQDNIANVQLKDIAPDTEKGVLAMTKAFALTLTFESTDNGETQKGENITKTIYQTDLKIKNFGDFRRFVKDRRLANLMFYSSEDRIERKALELELEQYDIARIEIFKAIANFERVVYPRYKDSIAASNKEHRSLLDAFCKDYPKFEPIKEEVLAIRNAFAHNQYPLFRVFQTEKPNGIAVANFLKDKAVKSYQSFSDILTNK